jgi:integrase
VYPSPIINSSLAPESEQLRLFVSEPIVAFERVPVPRRVDLDGVSWQGRKSRRNLLEDDPVSRYTPDNVDPADWSNVESSIRDFCLSALPVTTNDHVVVRSIITRFVYWAWRNGLSTNVDELLEPLLIEHFLDVQSDLSVATKGNYRSILRQIGLELIGPPRFYRSVPRASSRLQPPYSEDEISALYSWARHRRSPVSRDRLRVLMACGLGAGLTRQEILSLNGKDIDIFHDSVRIDVPGARSRQVWVDQLWESELAEDALLAGEGSLMGFDGKSDRQRDKAMSNLLAARYRYQGLPEFSVTRFRCTWIVLQLDRGVQPRLIADSAGIAYDQIGQYVEFTADYDEREVRASLRGAP